jgi:hypothetical protein
MSNIFTRQCNKCGNTTTDNAIAMDWPEVRIMTAHEHLEPAQHLCTDCLPALAAIFPDAGIEKLARHEMTIKVRETQRVLPDGEMRISVVSKPMSAAELAMASNARVASNRNSNVPSVEWFQTTKLVILGAAMDWLIRDIRVGNRSQFAQAGDVPGDMFAEGNQTTEIELEKWRPNMTFEIYVKYIGKNPEGALFACDVTGIAPGFAPKIAA